MKIIRRTSQFKKDVKRQKNRDKDFTVFRDIINTLAFGKGLDLKYRDHPLTGQFKGSRECHVESDWLLIYETDDSELILIRTGSHSDLFG